MPHVIRMKDGKTSTIIDEQDMFALVEEYAGCELRACISDLVEGSISDLQDCRTELKETTEELDKILDHDHSVFCNIREEAEALFDLLSDSRLNRKKIEDVVHIIWTQVNNEL